MQTLYSKEFVIAYEQKQSFLRGTVSTEGEIKGNNFVFIVEGTADEAVTRGANGNIPYAADNQSSATARSPSTITWRARTTSTSIRARFRSVCRCSAVVSRRSTTRPTS